MLPYRRHRLVIAKPFFRLLFVPSTGSVLGLVRMNASMGLAFLLPTGFWV